MYRDFAAFSSCHTSIGGVVDARMVIDDGRPVLVRYALYGNAPGGFLHTRLALQDDPTASIIIGRGTRSLN